MCVWQTLDLPGCATEAAPLSASDLTCPHGHTQILTPCFLFRVTKRMRVRSARVRLTLSDKREKRNKHVHTHTHGFCHRSDGKALPLRQKAVVYVDINSITLISPYVVLHTSDYL